MYRLTHIMLQNFEKSLNEFHRLFQGGRCQAWQLEELLVKAIRSDYSVAEKVVWKGNGHDIDADIVVNDRHYLQVKSGKVKGDKLILSGHRLGRYHGDLHAITNFLNSSTYTIVSVPYFLRSHDGGITHKYKLYYVSPKLIKIEGSFNKIGKSYLHTNSKGTEVKILPSMSWQVWWHVPMNELMHSSRDITIN